MSFADIEACGKIFLYENAMRNFNFPCCIFGIFQGFSGDTLGKESTCQGRRHKGCVLHPWVGKTSWSRKWEPTWYSCLEYSMVTGDWQAVCSPWGCKELNMTKHTFLQCRGPLFDPWFGKIPWRRERLLTPAFWPGDFHELYKPWGRKESDMTFTKAHMDLKCVLIFIYHTLKDNILQTH